MPEYQFELRLGGLPPFRCSTVSQALELDTPMVGDLWMHRLSNNMAVVMLAPVQEIGFDEVYLRFFDGSKCHWDTRVFADEWQLVLRPGVVVYRGGERVQ